MTLKNKILALIGFIAFSFLSIAMIGLQVLKTASESDNFARIEQIFKSAYSTISELENMAQTGALSESEAKQIAIRLLRENKYHPSEYVYVTDEKLDFIAAPHDPQLHGTSFNEFRDASGGSIGQIVAEVTARSAGEMVTYDWTSERDGEVVGLKSVAQKSKIWGWYIGTGISFKETDERFWSTAQWLLLASILLTVVFAVAVFRFGRTLTASLGAEVKDVVGIVSAVSSGDLTSTKDHYPRESVAGSLAYMKNALQGVVQEIRSVSDALALQVQETESQSTELDELTSSLESDTGNASMSIAEIVSNLNDMAERINDSSSQLEHAEQKGNQAKELTQMSTNAIQTLEQNIHSAGESVKQLATEVESIEGVLTVIQGVAEQTNLLALNAAIEAARAGEQGRGFAVVADEVRQLASRTSDSTKEIHSLIESLQGAAKTALSSVNDSIETSGAVVERSNNASTAITELLEIVSDVAALSHAISSLSSQQLSAAEGVNQSLDAISNKTKQTANVAKNTHEKSTSLLDYSNSLRVETEKFTL
ncbi:MAG: cache domain-containing protein [Gammaproteobacteria bacterium]|nr:cache domain-containing protein [Gammaproteobacteria bacterium]